MASSPPTPSSPPSPPTVNYVAGFLLVGLAWGLTTPFIRRAARAHSPPPHPVLESDAVRNGPWLKRKALVAFFAVADLLRNPRYAVPLLLNLTGSVWFFLLIGQAGESSLLFSRLFDRRPLRGCDPRGMLLGGRLAVSSRHQGVVEQADFSVQN